MTASLEQEENITAGGSKSSSSKAAASEGPEAYPLGYVEGLNDARTKLAGFFSLLLIALIRDSPFKGKFRNYRATIGNRE
jgi:hypothetical protein